MYSPIKIPKKYWDSSTSYGDVMLEYEEIASLKMERTRLNAKLEELERIRLIAKTALEAIDESGLASIAKLSLEEIKRVEKHPNE